MGLYVFAVAAAIYLLYTVIRLAVRKAMRQHQEWLDGNRQVVVEASRE